MQPGDLVTVYEDPETEAIREGDARLIRPIGAAENRGRLGVYRVWLVRFIGDDEHNVQRVIRVN